MFQYQILGENNYTNVERIAFDDHTLALCLKSALNAWDKIEESRKRTEPFTKII